MKLQETLSDIARAIVDHPEDVSVEMVEDDAAITLTLTVNPEDTGMVIGRFGKIAKAIRCLVKAAGSGCGKKVVVDIR